MPGLLTYSEREVPFSYYGYHNAEDVEQDWPAWACIRGMTVTDKLVGTNYFRERYCMQLDILTVLVETEKNK